jgi:hypothetical protein
MTGEAVVHEVAEKFYKGNTISAADKLLGDFRRGFLGSSSLEAPVDSELWTKPSEREREREREKKEKVEREVGAAEERRKRDVKAAVPLPVPVQQEEEDKVDKGKMSFGKNLDIGKGNYDGW